MGIILIILQIIEAIPTIISVVQEILQLIHRQPMAQRGELLTDLEHILQKHVDSGCDEGACKVDLEQFRQHLIEKYG